MVRLISASPAAPPVLPISDTSTGGAPRPKRQRGSTAVRTLRVLIVAGLVLGLFYMSGMQLANREAPASAPLMPPGAHDLPAVHAADQPSAHGRRFNLASNAQDVVPDLKQIEQGRQAMAKKALAAAAAWKEREEASAEIGRAHV